MNTCTRNMISSLAFMLAAIGSAAPAAAEKPTLVRDVDRASVTPVSVECEARKEAFCRIFTVPEGMVLVVDTLSVFASGVDPSIEGAFPVIQLQNQSSDPGSHAFGMIFSPIFAVKNLAGFVAGHVSGPMQFTAGAELTAGVLINGVNPPLMRVSLLGHLVAAGSP